MRILNHNATKMFAILPSENADLLKRHSTAPETKPFSVNENKNVPSVDAFSYLGKTLMILTDDDSGIKVRIYEANKALGTLNFVWHSKQASLEAKLKLFIATLLNWPFGMEKLWLVNLSI